jgi:hypothetical protein
MNEKGILANLDFDISDKMKDSFQQAEKETGRIQQEMRAYFAQPSEMIIKE